VHLLLGKLQAGCEDKSVIAPGHPGHSAGSMPAVGN
jgi:hypothetical protein